MSSEGGVAGEGASGRRPHPPGGAGLDSRSAEYARILRDCLPPQLQPLAGFFSYPDRLKVLAALLAKHLAARPGNVLNVGCGPFATEFFVLPLRPHRIVSFDYTRGFVPVYLALTRRGHLANTEFLIGDAMALEFRPASFDLIVMHDLLYEPALDFERMLVKYDRYLRPGGLLYLTVLDRGTRWIWKLLAREKPHVRYSLPAVRSRFERAGYRVLDCLPASLEAPGRTNRAFKRVLWSAFRLANHHALIARKAAA